MNRQRSIEILVGIFVLAAIAALIMLAVKVSGLTSLSQSSGYSVKADFDNIGGLKIRAPVTVGGVRIGQVSKITLNPKTFQAVVTFHIDNQQNQLPKDTSASILTAGLLGSNYIGLTPGYDTTYLKNGSQLDNTHSALILENLIGQLLYQIKK